MKPAISDFSNNLIWGLTLQISSLGMLELRKSQTFRDYDKSIRKE